MLILLISLHFVIFSIYLVPLNFLIPLNLPISLNYFIFLNYFISLNFLSFLSFLISPISPNFPNLDISIAVFPDLTDLVDFSFPVPLRSLINFHYFPNFIHNLPHNHIRVRFFTQQHFKMKMIR